MTGYQTYRVHAGDTLGRIARAFHTSVARIVSLNRLRNPDRIIAGQDLRVHFTIQDPPLGRLSRKYEVGGRGPGAVSGGQGDRGGVSYGSYQLAAALGRPGDFLAAEGKPWANRFAALQAGSAEFSAAWRTCAQEEPQAFEDAQRRYIERTHFQPQVELLRREAHLDVTTRSHALQEAVWSTAVQHGPACHIVLAALSTLASCPGDSDFDRTLIAAIYAERRRRLANGSLAHFRGNSPAVQEAVARRLDNECGEALALLATEESRAAA